MNVTKKTKWWVLFVTTSGTSTVFLDNTVMPVALPTIQEHMTLSAAGTVWIVNAYLLSLTAFLLVGGRLSDMLGRRNLFASGLAIFGLGSIIGGFSHAQWSILLGRAVQGFGGALTIPTTGALLIASFPRGERARAIGINTGISSIFLILGPAVGGVLTQLISWRSIFFINLPIVAFGIIMSYVILKPERRRKESFDFSGAISLSVGISCFVIAVMQGNEWGWFSPSILTLFGVSPLFFLYFLWRSTHTEHPLVDLSYFRIPAFAVASLCIFFVQVVVMVTVLWALYFQETLNYSPIQAGMLIFTAVFPVFLMAPLGGYLGDRFGTKVPLRIGFSVLTLGLIWLPITIPYAANLYIILPGLLSFGLGIPMIFAPTIAMALSEVPPSKLGAASAITVEVRQLASTTGIAFLSAIFTAITLAANSQLPAFQAVSAVAGLFAVGGLITAFLFRLPSRSSVPKSS